MHGNLDRLIKILCGERGENVPDLADGEKENYFRALCNVREPLPVTEEFLHLQDEYLAYKTQMRGAVDVNSFEYRNRIALWRGDITRLNADAIVNACNSRLLGCFAPLHECIDNVIHSNAGVQVRLDCNRIMQGGSEPNGRVRVTGAYNLPSRYIFHTVGPIASGCVTEQNETDLKNCYLSCLNKAAELGLSSIAFCCISTGVFGYPQDKACALAVSTVKNRLPGLNGELKVIFNVFTQTDYNLYKSELKL